MYVLLKNAQHHLMVNRDATARIKRLHRLVAGGDGPIKRGQIAAFAKLYGIDPTYISQLLKDHRPLGEKAARTMEEKLGKPRGWFDRADDEALGEEPQQQAGQACDVPVERALSVVVSALRGMTQEQLQALRGDWLALLRAPDSEMLYDKLAKAFGAAKWNGADRRIGPSDRREAQGATPEASKETLRPAA